MDDTLRAYRTALRDRRTVVLNLPLDVQAAEAVGEIPQTRVHHRPEAAPSAADLDRLVEAITASKRPVFIAGRGGRSAKQQITQLAEATGALVATSAVAKG